MKRYLFLTCFFVCSFVWGQNGKLDSLWAVYNNTAQADTNRLKAINEIAKSYYSVRPDTAIILAKRGLQLAEKTKQKRHEANAFNIIGVSFKILGNYPEALEYLFNALKIKEEIKDKRGIANCYINLGNIYSIQSDYPKALDYYAKSLKIFGELGNKMGLGVCYNNIGSIYQQQFNYPKALEYYFKSTKICEEIGDTLGIAECYNNIGKLYSDQSNYPKSLEYYLKALKIHKELRNSNGIGRSYNGIGIVYSSLSDFKLTIQYCDSGLKISKENGDLENMRLCYQNLADAYANIGRYKEAYKNHVQFKLLTDSIFNIDKSKKIKDLKNNYDLAKKDAEMKSQQAIDAEKRKKQRIIIYSVAALLLLALVFGVFMFNRFRITKKQKHIIVEKQKEILDSIHYAKRIQDALLKEQEHISVHLPEHFILFKPKDIVSGDFYWVLEKENNWYVAAADCTGHGVPGAFLTMLGTSFLNEINATEELLTPAEILNRLRARIIKELSQTGKDGGSKDGMDISLIRLNLQTKEMQWAGANNSLYLISNNELNETKADKQPIGYADNLKPFTDHLFQLQKGDSAIIFSDGYSDQFGGPKRRKFMSKQLKETLISISSLEMKEQKEKLNKTFEDWKGEGEQIDDVCVIGIRI